MAMSDKSGIPLYVFAKAPVPGKVKTRMQPELTDIQSAKLARLMLNQTLEKLIEFWPGDLVLAVTPKLENDAFQEIIARYQISSELQIGGDLGERMAYGLSRGIERCGCSAVIGCDVPQISEELIQNAHGILCNGENVIGPASDGGFYFLGLNKFNEKLFDRIDWGETEVTRQLNINANQLGIRLTGIAELRDIDTFEDLSWLMEFDNRYREL